MANKKRNFWDDEEFPQKAIDQDEKDYLEKIKDKVKYDISGNGEEPINRNDLGRNCPRCAGRLRIKEITDNGNVMVYCKYCRAEYYANDFDYKDELSDTIYKTISDKTFLYWQEFRKNQKKD